MGGWIWSIDQAPGFRALMRTPLVSLELLKPVSLTNSALVKPADSIMARKSLPGTAPPFHLAHAAQIAFMSEGNSPTRT
jgi:hypothetical protein